ncbi:MAG: hypothetical protein ISS36_04430 [Candidatus Aenigmarchaeota archaeon]|nr:hypothetical protein [Candidatus Aenigmarchaeota archaeon]
MKVLFTGEREKLSDAAGNYIAERTEQTPEIRLGGATGRSPKVAYATALGTGVDFSKAKIYFLDEYFGFTGVAKDGTHTTYRGYALLNLHIKPKTDGVPEEKVFQTENIWTPRGNFYDGCKLVTSAKFDKVLLKNPEDFTWRGQETTEVDELGLIRKYGIRTPLEVSEGLKPTRRFIPEVCISKDAKDPVLKEIRYANQNYDAHLRTELQVLGIGEESHIAFNEKGTLPKSRVHLTALALSTLNANEDDYSGGEASWYAITQGIGTIMDANELLLLAFGPKKTTAVRDMLHQDPSPLHPAAYMQTHPNVRLYIDTDALGECDMEALEKEWEIKDI